MHVRVWMRACGVLPLILLPYIRAQGASKTQVEEVANRPTNCILDGERQQKVGLVHPWNVGATCHFNGIDM